MLATTSPTYTLHDTDLISRSGSDEYVLRFKDLPDYERPREKMLAAGVESLTIAELVAILWGVGTRREDVLAMAKRTLQEYGERGIAGNVTAEQLAADAGIPLTKACQLLAGVELGRRFYATTRQGRPLQVRTQKQAYYYFKPMGEQGKEQLRGLYLNSRYHVIHDEVISIGSLTANIVHPREVFQPALEHGAIAVILAHNHPSGTVEPTTADLTITKQLVAAGKVLGIELLDHLVITGRQHISIMQCLEESDE